MNTRYDFEDGTVIISVNGKSEPEIQAEIRQHGAVHISAEKSADEIIKAVGNATVSVPMSADLWGFLEKQTREKAVHDEDERWYQIHRAIDLALIKAIQAARKAAV